MAQLDRFIQAMLQRPGAELFLLADHKPVLRANGRQAPIMDKQPSAKQLRMLVGEIAPGDVQEVLRGEGQASFGYQLDGGEPVELLVSEWEGDTSILIRAQGDEIGDLLEDPKGSLRPMKNAAATLRDPRQTRRSKRPSRTPKGPQPLAQIKLRPQIEAEAPDVQTAAMAAAAVAAVSAVKKKTIGPPPPRPSEGWPIDKLFYAMVKEKASDLHMTSEEIPMIRKDGDMVRLPGLNKMSADDMKAILWPIMPEKNREQFDNENDTDFAYEIPGLSRFRANIFRDRMGPGAVFRTIPTKILSAEELGLPTAVVEFGKLHKGLVLVTGPTGSGKSTTLAALIDYVNRTRSGHLITIEDPIEFVHPNKKCLVNQREVGVHTEGFKRALRAALREDPDIILVGEMRDLETIAIAIETAETGHLVFGTLHTTTAYSTVDRIIDQFPTDRQEQIRVMLSESLKGVVSQTLCKKVGGGRVAALEILVANSAVANLIREGKTFQIPSIMQTGRNLGMQLLNEALLDLVKKKLVDPNEAYGKAVDKAGMALMFKNNNISMG